MKSALIVSLALLFVAVPYSVQARQRQLVPLADGAQGISATALGVPSGYMILGETPDSPPGYSFSGLVLPLEPGAGTWRTGTAMPFGRTEFGAAVVGGRVYVIGGRAGGYTSSVEEFDPALQVWSPRAPMPTARCRAAVVVVDERIYAIGGENGSHLGVVEVFTPATNSWTACAEMPTSRTMLAAAAVGGKIYAIGGSQDGFVSLSVVEEFDPASNTWTTKAPIPTARGKLAVVVLNDKIFALGGYNDPLPVEVYDPIADQWTSRSAGPPVYDCAALTLNGRTFTLGGYYDHSGTFAGCFEYFADTDSWIERPSMQTARQSLAAVNVMGSVHAMRGNVYGGPGLATVEILDPPRQVYLHRKN